MRVGALYAVLRLEKNQFDAALTSAQSRFGAFAGVIRLGGLLISQGLAVAAAGSLAMAANFEQHMNQSLAIMGDVSDGMRQKMEDAARAVAKTSTFSAMQAADAYYFLASAGYTAEQSIAALPAVTAFAQAGVLDLEKATSLLMDTQTTLGLRTDDATKNFENMARVSDVLTAAAVGSNATLEQMAESLLNKAGPALRVVNKEVEEGAAVLMALANRGVKGREAGTALAIVLRELQTKAIRNKEAFAAAGVAVFDASGNMRNMADIIGDLEGALEGLTDEQKKEALLAMGFTDRSVGFIQAMLGSSEEIRKYEAQLREAGGTTQEVAQKQLGTLINQLILLWHTIQDVALTIGEKLMPGATNIVGAVREWIDVNGDLIASFVVGVFDVLGTFGGWLVDIGGWIVDLIDRQHALRAVLIAIGTVVAVSVVPPFMAWAAAVVVATWPLLALGAAVFGLAYALDRLGILDDVIDNVKTLAANATNLKDFMGDDTFVGEFADAFVPLADKIRAVVDGFANLEDHLGRTGIWGTIAGIVMPVAAAFEDVSFWVGTFIDNLDDLEIHVGRSSPLGTFASVVLGIRDAVKDTFEYLSEEVFPVFGEAIDEGVNGKLDALADHIDWIANDVGPKLIELFRVIAEDVVPKLSDALAWVADEVIPKFATAISWINENVLPAFRDGLSGLVTWFTEEWPKISGIVSAWANAWVIAFNIIWAIVSTVVPIIWAIIEPIASVLFPLIGTAASVLLTAIQLAFGAIEVVWEAARDSAILIANGIKGAFAFLGGFFTELWGGIVATFKWAVNQLIDVANGFISGLNNTVLGIPEAQLWEGGPKFGGGYFDPFNIPLIPHLAGGARNFLGGLALVGENGPELAMLPAGSNVYSNADMLALMGGGGKPQVVEYHRHFSPDIDVEGSMRDVETRDDLVKLLRDLSRLEE